MLLTHETRRESLEEILENLGGRQIAILSELVICGNSGTTASELANKMHGKGMFPTADRNFVHPRLNELVALEFVEIIGKRACSITGKTCVMYRAITDLSKIIEDMVGK